MLRRAVMAVAVLTGLALGQSAAAGVPVPIMANGQNTLASIDADNDGMIEEPDDCNLSAMAETNGSNLTVMGTQNPGPNLLTVCTGTCSGFGSASAFATTSSPSSFPGLVEVSLQSCTYSGPPWVPMVADFCDSSATTSCSKKSPTMTANSGTTAGQLPIGVTFGEVFQTSNGFFRSGFGRVCRAGSPVVQITGEGGVQVIRQLEPFPDAQNPTHMCVRNVPVELATGGFVFRMACFPIMNGMVDFTIEGSSFAIIELFGLPPCSSGTAPTMTQFGMILLIVSLLGFGVWQLGRRRAFYESLSLL